MWATLKRSFYFSFCPPSAIRPSVRPKKTSPDFAPVWPPTSDVRRHIAIKILPVLFFSPHNIYQKFLVYKTNIISHHKKHKGIGCFLISSFKSISSIRPSDGRADSGRRTVEGLLLFLLQLLPLLILLPPHQEVRRRTDGPPPSSSGGQTADGRRTEGSFYFALEPP